MRSARVRRTADPATWAGGLAAQLTSARPPGTALLSPVTVGVISVNPPCLYWASPAGDSVYLTNAVPAGVGLPMMVMSITCGEPDLVVLGCPVA